MLMIGERLRTIRESKNLSQGDIEKRTGMLRCYTSRVENGHTVPSIETLRSTHKRSTYRSIKSSTMVKPSQRRSKGWTSTRENCRSVNGARSRALAGSSRS
jgi:transcriptional regulator with XRE-family HTH domain